MGNQSTRLCWGGDHPGAYPKRRIKGIYIQSLVSSTVGKALHHNFVIWKLISRHCENRVDNKKARPLWYTWKLVSIPEEPGFGFNWTSCREQATIGLAPCRDILRRLYIYQAFACSGERNCRGMDIKYGTVHTWKMTIYCHGETMRFFRMRLTQSMSHGGVKSDYGSEHC